MRCQSCGRPKLQDLFSGEGGAGAGYWLAGFCPDPVDSSAARLKRYPRFCRGQVRTHGDALDAIASSTGKYAARHASPTCTGYSRGTAALPDRLDRYDRLIPVVRVLLQDHPEPYVIENVADARSELDNPTMLCWSEFFEPGSVEDTDGTPLTMRRHRLFESSIRLTRRGDCRHPRGIQVAGSYGGARRDPIEARTIRKGGYVPKSTAVQQHLLGTPWMSEKGCQLSIPPAYTQHIGAILMDHIEPADSHAAQRRLEALSQSLPSVTGDLDRLDYLTEIINSAETLRAATVESARQGGHPWQAIGNALGVTKQAAQKRYTHTPASTNTDARQMEIPL